MELYNKLPLSIFISFLLLVIMSNSSIAQDLQQDCLPPHNSARADVGVPPLVWDTTLEAYAQNYANARKGDCRLEHSKGPYGENIAWSSGTSFSCSDAVGLWVNEKAFYDYDSNSCAAGRVCGHYTQVVWRDTTHVGCAKVICDDDKGTFVICSYSPPGNYEGELPY